MPRVGWLLLAFVGAAGIAVAAAPRPPAEAVVLGVLDAAPADDPFPIRRVRCTDAQLPTLLKELGPEPLVWVPRADFERRVQEAIDAFKISLWSEETADAHVALGDAYLQAKDPAAARAEAERAVVLAPQSPAARRLLEQTTQKP